MLAVLDASAAVGSGVVSELGEGGVSIEETEVWRDIFGSGNLASFSSLPSVVTWNHWRRMQCIIGNDGFKGNEPMFSSFPSVVTWISHHGLKQMDQ
eukprot:3840541-Rhodomonas_salina.1